LIERKERTGRAGYGLNMRIILNIGTGAILALLAGTAGTARGADDVAGAIETPFERTEAPGPEHGKAFTGDATPVEPGHVELEIAYAPSWWAVPGSLDGMSSQAHPVAASITVGIVRNVDARVVVGWEAVHATTSSPGGPAHGEGPVDTTVAARWRFLSLADPAIDLAVTLGVTAPTGLRETADHLGTGRGAWSVGGSVLASADWGRLTAGLELGLAATVGPNATNDVGMLVCNGAVGYQVLPWLQPELELNYQHEIELGAQPDERVLWATAALVLPIDPVRLVVGGRLPVWSSGADVGPMATAAVKIAF
jgi:hypothetical protein